MTQTDVGGTVLTTRSPPSLRRNARFQTLWAGSAASLLGARMADTAYPLLLLSMTGSPSVAGAFGAVQLAATLAFGLHGGSIADRCDRRKVLIIADGIRCLITSSIPVALWLHCLTVAQTMLVAVSIGAATAYGAPSRLLAVRSVVPQAQLRQALAQDEARSNGAGLIGPPVAGLLFGLARMAPFIGTALGSFTAFLAACLVRFDGRAGGRRGGGPGGGALEGLRYLARSRELRPTLAVACALNVTAMAVTLPVVVLLRSHHTASGGIGLALSGEAVGGIAGAFLIGRLHRMMRPGKLLLISTWACVPLLFAPLLPGGPVTVFLSLAVMMLTLPALRVMIDVLIFQRVDDALRGRVVSATMNLFMLGMPAGLLGSGLLVDHTSPAVTFAVLAALLTAALVPATRSASLRATDWPAT
ncbi:MFS transporter [Streptomyces sp. SL13]|uniref:MFS transporter n=1 Tax=Streptantibioticus silvisoli TaxID=2705255 RepID=A0AA90H3K6_9ACTN|nr:MFS transporter [Streptantibioticus silvisoli]MDI5966508.1 MFS transporter [Streptantibioticus silvisoli]MDI5970358.1 MFS transporter [Streptantibioticus silvisoli]